jgi:hypothetical protein
MHLNMNMQPKHKSDVRGATNEAGNRDAPPAFWPSKESIVGGLLTKCVWYYLFYLKATSVLCIADACIASTLAFCCPVQFQVLVDYAPTKYAAPHMAVLRGYGPAPKVCVCYMYAAQ